MSLRRLGGERNEPLYLHHIDPSVAAATLRLIDGQVARLTATARPAAAADNQA